MFSKVLILFVYVLVSEAQFEGESCLKSGAYGVCRSLNRCQAAIDDLKRKINPQLCSFNKTEPIVCCLDGNTAANPGITTTERPSTVSNTEYIPPMYDYYEEPNGKCAPIPEVLTLKKTGQKALDKCIEYQEKYVYPCEKNLALTGEVRKNKCHQSLELTDLNAIYAERHDFPHVVMMGYGENIEDVQFLCGGALISDRYVLTAGHCISRRDLGPITYVLVGALKRSDAADRSKIYKVKNIIKHPEYKPPSIYNDIALIETEKTITLSEFVVPACLPAGDAIDEERVRATGWGLNQDGESDSLLKEFLQKFSTSECKQKFQSIRLMKQGFDAQSQTCYGVKQSFKGICLDNSGGLIQIKNKKISCTYNLVGVTSYGQACGLVGEPTIYTRVLNYVPWIESIVWPNF